MEKLDANVTTSNMLKKEPILQTPYLGGLKEENESMWGFFLDLSRISVGSTSSC